ncbi:hypothetical protein GCM10022206_41830 [Streptomyces chiangmaiensis]
MDIAQQTMRLGASNLALSALDAERAGGFTSADPLPFPSPPPPTGESCGPGSAEASFLTRYQPPSL